MSKARISDLIAEWMEPFGKEQGYELSRCEYVKEGPDHYLRVYVDKLENGEYGIMSTDDCETVSRYLSDRLDEADPIKENYYLEVSSPGMDRLLVSEKDFRRFTGEIVEAKLYKALDGKKLIVGELKSYEDGTIVICDNGKDISLKLEETSKVNLAVIF